jgi:CBS domain-containing protein
MKTIAQILDSKPREIITVRPSDSVLVALEVLAAYNIGALPVVSDGQVAGIFSERDYARKVALKGLTSTVTEVGDIMTAKVFCADIKDSVLDCMSLMTEKRIRHLPVLENGELVGMLSIGDLVKAIIEDQQFQIQQLESYINPALSLH